MKEVVRDMCGFIAINFCCHYLKKDIKVYSVDNLNNYYFTKYKNERLKSLKTSHFIKLIFLIVKLVYEKKLSGTNIIIKIKFINEI